ncbi:MAG: hypothetical protein OEV06_05820 [Anaerolineae bacterium]|nr:hypothetical protein [Anaerolineae bacterium]
MNKTKSFFAILLLSLFIVACGGSPADEEETNISAGDPSPSTPGAQDRPSGDFDMSGRPLSPQEVLIIGVFRLEGTPYEVASSQAAELLPLWQVLANLVASDTTAEEEITALLDQITSTFTPEQLQAIEDLQLVQQDLSDLMAELGIELAAERPGALLDQNSTGDVPQRLGRGEGLPGQGPGNGPGASQDLSPEEIATARAEREAAGGGFGFRGLFNPELLQAVIDFLGLIAAS